jgi:hypothetical protein
MATEHFLINAPKLGRKRKSPSRGKVSRAALAELRRHFDSLRSNPLRRLRMRRAHRRNPFGEEVMIVGLNPRRKILRNRRRFSMSLFGRVRRRRRIRHNRGMRLFRRYRHNPRRRYRYNARRFHYNRFRGRRYRHNRFYRRYRHNPRRRSYHHNRARRYRHNPVSSFRQLGPMIIAGTAGAVVTNMVSNMIGAGGVLGWGVRLAVAVGGGYAVDKMISRSASDGWMIGSIAPLVYDIFVSLTGGAFGLRGVGAFPDAAIAASSMPGTYGMAGYGSYADYAYSMPDSVI